LKQTQSSTTVRWNNYIINTAAPWCLPVSIPSLLQL